MTAPRRPLAPDQAYGLRALGAIVRQSRRDAGISQRTLAEVVGVHQSVISRLETGKLDGLRLRNLGAVIAALDGRVEFWMGHATRRLPHDPGRGAR
jgi:transcriptional regulator with XRE-family HTH domain